MTNLDDFETLVKSRRSTRNFKPDPVPADLLDRLIDIARWSPSGYNLQPTHFVVVTDPAVKARLVHACMGQRQVAQAPAVVVITGDRRVVRNNFEDSLAADRAIGAVDDAYEKLLRKFVPLAFDHGPAGIGWLLKATVLPAAGLVTPMPSIPAVFERFWLAKQTMLCAMTLMLAAKAAGLASSPMEGFDERRVRQVLRIPRSQIVSLVLAIGYAADTELKKSRLPIHRFVHRDRW